MSFDCYLVKPITHDSDVLSNLAFCSSSIVITDSSISDSKKWEKIVQTCGSNRDLPPVLYAEPCLCSNSGVHHVNVTVSTQAIWSACHDGYT